MTKPSASNRRSEPWRGVADPNRTMYERPGFGRIWRQGYRQSWAWEPPDGGPTIYGFKTMKAAKERAESV